MPECPKFPHAEQKMSLAGFFNIFWQSCIWQVTSGFQQVSIWCIILCRMVQKIYSHLDTFQSHFFLLIKQTDKICLFGIPTTMLVVIACYHTVNIILRISNLKIESPFSNFTRPFNEDTAKQ